MNGLISSGAEQTSPAQIVVGLLDRMTEHHVIVLLWESQPKRSYTLGEIRAEEAEEARRSHFFGQPVFTDRTQLRDPINVFTYMDWGLYVDMRASTRPSVESMAVANVDRSASPNVRTR